MATSNPDFPTRLVEGEDQAAALIARALAEPAPGPTEQQSWDKLSSRSQRFTPRWALPAAAFALSAAAVLAWFLRPAPAPVLGPDVWARSTAATPLPAPAPSSESAPADDVAPAPESSQPPRPA